MGFPVFPKKFNIDEINMHLKFFVGIISIRIKTQIFNIYFYHLRKHFAKAQPKSAMLIITSSVIAI